FSVELAAGDHPLISQLGHDHVEAYLDSVPAVRLRPEIEPVRVAYTAMHGVGGATFVEAFERSGLGRPEIVEEQFAPDADFPTVPFPNPEEPGAMDRVIDLAERVGASLAIANDPDADRVGAAVPTRDGGWRRLGGDEIGWLLADHILRNTSGDDRLVVTTLGCGRGGGDSIGWRRPPNTRGNGCVPPRVDVTTLVSSSMLRSIAAEHGVHAEETFTGFKWIAHTVGEHPDLRFVFGYEQALGYLVAGRPLDKDGITASVLLAEVAALARAEGTDIEGRLDELAERHGRHVMVERSVRMEPVDGAAAVARLRAEPPATIDGRPVEAVEEYPEAGLLRLVVAGGIRVQVRPSGTEPKVKIYGEGVGIDPTSAVEAVIALLA
ncbi:MAG: hypothetical protein VW396_03130, partial [Ilumatobacter sp.]